MMSAATNQGATQHTSTVELKKALDGKPELGFEIFNLPTFKDRNSDSHLRKTTYIQALQVELERTITHLEGIKSARVSITIDIPRMFVGRFFNSPSVSVTILPTSNGAIEKQTLDLIRILVGNGVPIGSPDRVTISVETEDAARILESPGEVEPVAEKVTVPNPTEFDENTDSPAEDGSTDSNYSNPQRQAIVRKLDQLILEEFPPEWEPGDRGLETSLAEILRQLDEQVKKLDPEKRGINFIVNSQVDQPGEERSGEQLELTSNVVVAFGAPLRNVSARDVLDAICKLSQSKKDGSPFPLEYSIEDYAVVISSALMPGKPQLFTRVFRLDPKAFLQQLDKLDSQNLGPVGAREGSDLFRLTLSDSEDEIRDGNSATALKKVNELVREFFKNAGVEFSQTDFGPLQAPVRNGSQNQKSSVPQKAVFFNDRTGHLFVRATLAELDSIEQTIQKENAAPRQVAYDVKFVEMPEWDAKALDLDRFSNTSTIATNDSAALQAGESSAATNSRGSKIVGILSAPEFLALMTAMKQKGGVDILASPKVTTSIGRNARVSVGGPMDVVTRKMEGTNTATMITTQVWIGPSLELFPQTAQDDSSINLSINGTHTEFLGYDDPGPFVPNASIEESPRSALPRPRIRTRVIQGKAILSEGQTLTLGADPVENTIFTKSKVPILGDIPLLGRLFRRESKEKRRMYLFVFVTPTLVDPVGNHINAPPNDPK